MQTFDDFEILALIWLGLVFVGGLVFSLIGSAIARWKNRRRRRPMATFKKGIRNVR